MRKLRRLGFQFTLQRASSRMALGQWTREGTELAWSELREEVWGAAGSEFQEQETVCAKALGWEER